MVCWVFGKLVLRFWVLTGFRSLLGSCEEYPGRSLLAACESIQEEARVGRCGSPRRQHQRLPGNGEGNRRLTGRGLHRLQRQPAVDTTLIPAGAALDTTGLTAVDESVKPVPRT